MPVPQPRKQDKGLSMGQIIVIALVIVAIISGGLYILVVSKASKPPTSPVQDTSTSNQSQQTSKTASRTITCKGLFMANGAAHPLTFTVTESQEEGLFVYRTQSTARDSFGDFNIEARSVMAWPYEGLVEIKKRYT